MKMSGAKQRKLTSSISGETNISISQVGRNGQLELTRHEDESKKLRESVLNKLWDSLPPETQILSHSDEEDSDATRSGLDEGEAFDKENVEECPEVRFSKSRTPSPAFSNTENIKNKQSRNKLESGNNFQTKSYPKKIEDSTISWNNNLDFIQSIIWLKSTTSKLQRVPADEFLKVFQNQWELSPNINSTQNHHLFESRGSSIKTKQLEKIDLIKNRLGTHVNIAENQYSDIVIPETDESEAPSLQSSQCVAEKPATNITAVLESIENLNRDSGFGSEKPESVEMIDSSQYVIGENLNKNRKIGNVESTNYAKQTENLSSSNSVLGARDRGNFFQAEQGCSSREKPFREIDLEIKTWGKGTTKRKYDEVFGAASKLTNSKKTRLSISSATLNYVLRSSECNKVLLSSVRVILKVLEKENYKAGNNWYDSVKKEAIEAIVEVVDLLEKEKGSNSCRNEVVATVKRVLEKMLFSSEVDKPTEWEHHRLVILELCSASSVCRKIVNYLILESKKLIPILMQTTEKNMRESMVVMDKSYILFHSLKITLKKYRSFTPTSVTTDEINISQRIPEVTDLWKRHWRVNENETDIFVTGLERLEIPDDSEEVWTRVLEELVLVSTTIWPLVKIMAWQCLAVLKSTG